MYGYKYVFILGRTNIPYTLSDPSEILQEIVRNSNNEWCGIRCVWVITHTLQLCVPLASGMWQNLRWPQKQHHYFWYYAANSDCSDPKLHSWTSRCISLANSPSISYWNGTFWMVPVCRVYWWPLASSSDSGHAICMRQMHPAATMAFCSSLQMMTDTKKNLFNNMAQ